MVHPIAEGFPWGRLGYHPRLPPTKSLDLLLRSQRRIREWGIAATRGNRLDRVESLLRGWAEPDHIVSEDPREMALLAEATRTSVEFYIASHGPGTSPTEVMREKVVQALGGADLPEDEEQHFARNIQFELYVHGLLAAGGASPWFEEPPDLRFRYGEEVLGIAVKRLWSREGAHGRLSDGAGQVEGSGIRGLIAANAQEYVEGVPADEAIAARGQAFNEYLVRLHGQFPYLARKPHIVGLMVCGTAAEWAAVTSGPRQLRVAMYNQLLLLGNSDEDEAFANHFYGLVGETLKEWFRLNI